MTKGLSTVVYQEGMGFLSPIEDIIEDLRNGRMVILVDAEDRENEGDLIIPAQMATPDAINFMARHGRGLICLSLTEIRAKELRLASMVPANASRTGTAFTVSIEAREGITTGISAADRARTIATAIDATKGCDDIVSPGHVFPLVARTGGVLVRAGHTEASVDLARLAGLYPAAVICEIMNDDGTMARVPDLVPFAQRHGLKVGTIESLIAFRLKNDRVVREIACHNVESAIAGRFDLRVFETAVDGVEHIALVKGDIAAPGPVLVRVHAVNPLADLIGIGPDGRAAQEGAGATGGSVLERAMRAIEAEGRGVIVLLRDLRARSVSERLAHSFAPVAGDGHPRKIQGHERRQVEIGIGSQILRVLGVTEMTLLSNSPEQVYVGLEGYGLRIVGQRAI
ncbi:MAG: 3,4-dihydroxy-2-butanone-4-phosphate synthase [Hyphomicrobiaceae bacterium]